LGGRGWHDGKGDWSMDPHFTVRFLIVSIVLIYVVVPMIRQWRKG
jgi:hypothetical protein